MVERNGIAFSGIECVEGTDQGDARVVADQFKDVKRLVYFRMLAFSKNAMDIGRMTATICRPI